MFDPDAHVPRINRGMAYLGACLIAGIRFGSGAAGECARGTHRQGH
jgi:hypothetical protein